MKPIRHLLADARRHQGLALIIVLSMLALATIVILAFLSVADTEHKATTIYSASQTSRRLADTAVNIVMGQIRSGSAREQAGVPVIHATQPGAVRKYSRNGAFLAGYKLFSDRDMIFRSTGGTVNQREMEFVRDSEPPADWNQNNNLARYVDLNEPVIKGVASQADATDTVQIYFPIIDPRAGQDLDAAEASEVPVEGFSYELTTSLKGNNIGREAENQTTPAIVKPSDATSGGQIDQLRLAMPVQWLYVLRDGAVGYLNDNMNFRVLEGDGGGLGDGPSSVAGGTYGIPTESNPIVGRIAFWTDDETCKVNINTAAEPTFAGQPIYYHERDHRWADYPPARGEYQRFPGHPATVALSSVFYPNPQLADSRSLDTYGLSGPITGGALSRALAVKSRIYELMPRITEGGSYGGTLTFEQDEYATTTTGSKDVSTLVDIKGVAGERLYASVDELLFSQNSSGGNRVINNADGGNGITLFNKRTLERSSAFLTAHSRGSEINMFGMPRIAMWPLPRTASKRTGFDNLMYFCSRLGNDAGADNTNSYIFQREHSASRSSVNGARYDISLPRNLKLLSMLDRILDAPFPTASENASANGTAKSFVQKITRDNTRQLIVSMFDYIRSTNLYDSFLVPDNRNEWPSLSINWTQLYQTRDRTDFKTYTPGVVRNSGNTADPFSDRFFPGHGQVTPSEHPQWVIGSTGDSVRGFGRFFSVSEVGLHFICTADGKPDMYSWRIPIRDENGEEKDYKIPEMMPAEFDSYATAATPVVSGGRTALKVRENNLAHLRIAHSYPPGFSGEVRLTNVDAVHWRNGQGHEDGFVPDVGMIKERYYSNFPPLSNPTEPGRYGTLGIPLPAGSANYARYYRLHPGYNWENWNWTLERDTPMLITQKRIQALLHLEFFCPSASYTEINPDYTIVISGNDVSNIQVAGRSVFSTTQDIVLRSERPMYDTDGNPEIGGFASFRNVAAGRRVGARGNMPEDVGFDTSATGQAHAGLTNLDLVSSFFTVDRNAPLQFSSGTITVKIYDHHVTAGTGDDPVQVIQFRLRDGKAPTPDLVTAGSYLVNYVQSDGSTYNHPAVQAPRWWSFNRDGALGRYDDQGGATNPEDPIRRSIRGRFYNWDGVSINNITRAYDPRASAPNNQSVPGARSLIYTKDPANYASVQLQSHVLVANDPLLAIAYGPRSDVMNNGLSSGAVLNDNGDWDRPWHYGSDVVRTLQPAHGDARLIAAKKTVPASDWTPHRFWDNEDEYMAHNFSSYSSGTEPGFDRGTSNTDTKSDDTVRGLPVKVTASASRSPDAPHGRSDYAPTPTAAHQYIQRYYDFDDSDPGGRIGPFINKVDEGNYSVGDFKLSGWPDARKWRSTYFRSNSQGARFANGKGSFFTPNRMVPSPVVMGSLPSHVWDNNGSGAWTNLLFRPYVSYPNGLTGARSAAASTHPGAETPPDHYLLDLFWMPVVEPYAISEPLSTAGKINLNYQMVPFTHIRRATALHAAMKGEIMAAMPNAEYEQSKGVKTGWGTNGSTAPIFRSEADGNYWHRGIVVDRFKPSGGSSDSLWWQQQVKDRVQGTLRQFEERFNFGIGQTSGALKPNYRGGLFRTTSQLCEVHLIPDLAQGKVNVSASGVANASSRDDAMARFWAEHCSTGDNTRERPYANLYQKFTTRSNTFRVHVRAQSIRKAVRSVEPDFFDLNRDQVSGEFRGSFLVERYIDQADMQAAGTAVDYASASDPFALKPLESYYRFRIIESKRFAP
ncbi:Verru_Chthon cassette protein A [Prosthecobacter debontii]|uniref:Verru_Chthon cassette protein A n=1 Tax=Prosthecobacter debontii TaxID=48467 RepID=A0A1T4WTK1_9BACT|nr:Verru_Chthon cassette protein A [Prosthecobacter debontii]SKA80700.1 Verru_Chthon cassette protein A [Prosthecobacter debontii]